LTGALFREFAFTLAGAVTVSGFVALTLSPMMSAYLLKDASHEAEGLSGFITERFDRVRDRYESVLGHMLGLRDSRKISWRVLIFSPVVAIPLWAVTMGVLIYCWRRGLTGHGWRGHWFLDRVRFGCRD